MNSPELPARPHRTSALAWLLLLLVLPVAAWLGWQAWQAQSAERLAAAAAELQRLTALEERMAAVRRNQQAQGKRLQQAETTNRVLRDELLGVSQRAALLEESVQRLAGPVEGGAQALRLDDIELLLAQGQQRLLLAADLDGARRAYALAARLLDAVTDPGFLDIRQVLVQERTALDALGDDPRVVALARLDVFAAQLDALPLQAPPRDPAGTGDTWWERLAHRVVDVRRSDARQAVAPAERAAGIATLRLELALARTAAERRDAGGWRAALARAEAWLPRLWPDSPTLQARMGDLRALGALPLAVALPTLGSTLQQLRLRRGAPRAAR
ncbi:uroporphyrinogen-III C-methyltransferase [Luteimonas sp. MC1572]|uniref:uroporphyrinogen-III C-methyltransferase n=1 Tax=Luteimonas sp. MC1572 TaxID=2799325 RepID=UPI0018F06D75|nr:uroporphyrinogen-III C-methyltransferase [Luteimonas sp. MC1572]MBJ6982064.1 uroporphyrinogen-III C-methyltransferase [Luteimonas sp. MC1572]QQO03361.1 uroporphyrinogen-III C-methyltransferase [Luteimonas sp. MC1572]